MEEKKISNKERRHLKRKELDLLDETEVVRLVVDGCISKVEKSEGNEKRKKKKAKLSHSDPLSSPAEGDRIKKKMLLILDINKVLVYRLKGCSNFTPRPHVHEFLRLMSDHYHLAVWTSMQKSTAKKVMKELFHDRKIPLHFAWFQNKCKIIRDESPEAIAKDAKPDFFKNLVDVWQQYPLFDASNTVRDPCLFSPVIDLISRS